jgi:hypothetical protein
MIKDKFSVQVNSFCSFFEARSQIFLKERKTQITVNEATNPANKLKRKAGLCEAILDKTQPNRVNIIEPGAAVNPKHTAASEYSLESHHVIDGYEVVQYMIRAKTKMTIAVKLFLMFFIAFASVSARGYFSAKQKPAAYGGSYVQLALPEKRL